VEVYEKEEKFGMNIVMILVGEPITKREILFW
jgi:hypothetical protein